MHCTIEHASQRLINHTQHANTILGESDLNGEIAIAVDETICTVEWIDHPHTRLCQSSLSINRLFGKDSVVRKLALQPADDQLGRDHVSLSDGLDVVLTFLLLDIERAVVLLENGSTRRAC